MNKVFVSLSLCVLLVLSVTLVEAKRSGSRSKPSGGSRRQQPTQKKPDTHQTASRNHTSGFGGGSHGGTNQHFLDNERHDSNNRGHIGFENFNKPSQTNTGGLGFGGVNSGSYKPSAPPAGGHQGGIGSAFGGANYPAKTQNTHVQSAPYPTHNNPGGFGNAPAGGTHYNQPGGFGTNPGGFGNAPAGGTHYNQPGGFGTNPVGGTHHQPGAGFGSNPAGGTHYNPGGQPQYNQHGFGQPGQPQYNQHGFGQPGQPQYNQHGFGQPGQPQYNQHGFGQPGQPHYNQPSYGGAQPNYGVGQSGGFGGHQPGYQGYNNFGGHPGGSYGGNPGGYAANPGGFGGYNSGGFGGYGGGHNSFGHGGHPSGGFGGYPQGGGFSPGSYKQNSGPGFGTGLLGGAAGGVPLGLLLGYGLGSMSSSHSSPFSSNNNNNNNNNGAANNPAANAPANNEAFNEWLKQRTLEREKELAANATIAAGGDPKTSGSGQTAVAVINKTEIASQILNETQMCPGGAGILDVSVLNTLVPCNVTQVDFNVQNFTEPITEDCKSLTLDLVQVNTDTNENKTLNIRIKQNNATGTNEFVVLTYDVDLVSCIQPLSNPDGKKCETKTFTADPYHLLNETVTYLHTTNISLSQYTTTLNLNTACAQTGACGPDSKPPRNVTSTFINLSILPVYATNIMMSQCMIFKPNTCDPASTTPCEAPSFTTLQSIHTNTSLSKSDFANINFVLHQSADVFTANIPPPQPSPAPEAQPGSTSTLTDTKSSAATI